MNVRISIILIVCCMSLIIGCQGPKKADLILRGGKVVTLNDESFVLEAVAIRGNKILFVGSDADVEWYMHPKVRVIELNGNTVVPGMIDAHGHPFNLGKTEDEETFSVTGTTSWQDVVNRVAKKVKMMKPGQWLIGGGWYQDDWTDNTLPVHDALSQVSPENPVFLYRRGGNSAMVNRRAMDIAGIDRNTPDPYGGKIIRKPDGEPTGFLINMGNNLVKKHFPKPDKPQSWYRETYLKAARMCNEVGLTGWHDAGIEPEYIEAYKGLVDRNQLTVRVYAMLQNPREGDLAAYFRKHRILDYRGKHFLSVRSVKVFFDGALGSRGAAFFEPYEDDPDNIGIFEVPPEHVTEVARAALKTGMQVCAHAIGIRGNSVLLDAYEKAIREYPGVDHRFRSEHAEVVRPQDVKRFASLGVIPSVQPIHHTSDMEFLEDRIGRERVETCASPWRSFIDAGCILPCGSDFAIYSHNPLTGIHAAVTRQDANGFPEGGWQAWQRMTREEALRGYTIWAARAAFQEDVIGSIEAGKLADLVVLDKDILTIEPEEILTTEVLMTIVGGKIVYQRND